MMLHEGAPENLDGRIENERKVYALLESLNVPFWQVDHPAAMTMEDCKAVDDALGAMVCKNLVLCNRQKTMFYLLLVPGDKKFQTKVLSHALGVSRLSFAEAEHLKEYLDVTPGSVSVMCLMNDAQNRVQLLVDRDVMAGEFVGFHPCINTSSLRVRQKDLWEKIVPALHHVPQIVDLPTE